MKYWTEKEIEYLKENYSKTCPRDIAQKLDRPISSVWHKASRLNIQSKNTTKTIKPMLENHINLRYRLKKLYWDIGLSYEDIALLFGVYEKTIYRWMKQYKIPIKKITQHVKYQGVACPLCGFDEDIVGSGYTYGENGFVQKRYKCNVCGKFFYIPKRKTEAVSVSGYGETIWCPPTKV